MSLFTGVSKPGQGVSLPPRPSKSVSIVHPFSDKAHSNPKLLAMHELRDFIESIQSQKITKTTTLFRQKLVNKANEVETILRHESVHSEKFQLALQELLKLIANQK